MILQQVKKIAMDYENNSNIKKEVIKVPVYFSDLQRKGTMEKQNQK